MPTRARTPEPELGSRVVAPEPLYIRNEARRRVFGQQAPGGRGGGGSRFFTHATSGREALVGVEDDSHGAAPVIGAVIEARVPRVVRINIVARHVEAARAPGLRDEAAREAPEQLLFKYAGAVEVEGRVSYTPAHEHRVIVDGASCRCRELRDLRTRVVLAVVLGRREG
jgi:hypothetical protein